VGDTGKVPLRYLIEGSKRANVELNLTAFSLLAGVLKAEIY